MSSPQSPACLPPQGIMQFFPGLKGDKGDKGDTGAPSTVPGPAGPGGAIGVYVGTYDAATEYNDSTFRKDIVDWNGGFWITNNTAKNGLSNWLAPTVADWAYIGDTFVNIATALRLLAAQDILVGLNFISPAYLKSNNFVEFVSGWVLSGAGRLEAYDALIAGQISTDSPRFNLESVTRTMPAVAYAEFDIAAIVDGDIPTNPTINNVTDDALIFFGWLQGANTFVENRFGSTQQKFTIGLEGTGSNTSGGAEQFFIQIYYRTRNLGGSWGAWNVIGRDWYMNKVATVDQPFQLVRDLSITLTGDDDIQFSAGFSKGTGGTAAVAGAKISVKAYN